MNIKQLIEEAFYEVSSNLSTETDALKLHRERSKLFVEALAEGFRNHYKSDSYYVFSKHFEGNRKKFGVNELLYDILVCRGAVLNSSNRHSELTYITDSIWQVESEFARDSRQALYDFNKLIIGSSENKLFIGPQVSNEVGFLDTLAKAAKHCHATTYLALLPHPKEWANEKRVKCWVYENGWKSLSGFSFQKEF
jgi:hypothetical protein